MQSRRLRHLIINFFIGMSIAMMSIAMAVFALTGCSRKADSGKLKVAVTTPALGRIVEEIAGDDVEIITLLPAGADPETYEPDMGSMKQLADADVFLTLNTIGFEQSLSERLKTSMPDLRIIDLSKGVSRITDTHPLPHSDALGRKSFAHSATGDPHLLSSPANARIVLKNTTEELISLYPDNEALYKESARQFDNRLALAQAEVRSGLEGERGMAFVVTHPSLSYFASEFGLRQISIERDGKETTPRQLEERIKEARDADARFVAYEKSHNPQQALHIAKELGIPAIAIDFNGKDFVEQYNVVLTGEQEDGFLTGEQEFLTGEQ